VTAHQGTGVAQREREDRTGKRVVEQAGVANGMPTPDRLLMLGSRYRESKALFSAVELGVFSELGRGPLDGETLRRRIGVHARGARDFFDSLVALGLLEGEDGRYRNTAETEAFLDPGKPSYIGGFLKMANTLLYPLWNSLSEGLRTGQPQREAAQTGDLFGTLYRDPDRLRLYLQAMTGLSIGPATAIAEAFPWRRYQTVVDVGCAQGSVPVRLALAHPHLTGGGFDLPPAGPIFEEYVGSAGLGDRLSFYAGNFFADPLPRADVLVMRHILHDWDLEQKRLLVGKAYEALPAGGALVVYDAMIDDERRANAFGLLMSLHMLLGTAGGFDYTGAECRAWLRDAGFRDTHAEPLVGPYSVVVGVK
jgi:hypothetical protein